MNSYSATNTQSVRDAKRKLTKFLKTVETVPIIILEEEAERINEAAKSQTPVETGKLRNSVRVHVSKSRVRPGLTASASARDHGYNYAGIQHENENYYHSVGKAHYISDPFNEGTKRIIKRLKREVTYK